MQARRLAPLSMFFLCLAPTLLLAAPRPLDVRYYNANDYFEKGELKFVVETRDENIPVEGMERGVWSVESGGKPVQAELSAANLRTAEMPTAVFVIIATTANFAGSDEADPAKEGVSPPVEYAMQGLNTLKPNLGKYDLLSIACYDEVRPDAYVLVKAQAVDKVKLPDLETIQNKCRSAPPEGAEKNPRLQTLLKNAVKAWLTSTKGKQSGGKELLRFAVVVITDGASREPIDDQEPWWRSLQNTIGDATEGWLEVYVIGLEDGGDPDKIAALAKGGYLGRATTRQSISEELGKIGSLVAGTGLTSVVATIKDRITGPTVDFALQVKGQGNQEFKSDPIPFGKLERKRNWIMTALWIVGILVGVVLLFLLIRWLVGVIVSRRQARDEEAARIASQQYDGPSLGKIMVRDGPCAGQVFHLIEELSYIGRAPENHIVLTDTSVGKRHASIRVREKSYELEDLQSVNGVFLNGQKVLKAFMKDGDSIRLGSTEMQFHL